jgi:hypothetical protein
MELEILKKKISTYRSEGGYLKNIPDELTVEILLAWERWTGPAGGFYTALGADAKRMASIIGRGKKLKREGRVPVSEFKEITDAVLGGSQITTGYTGHGIELTWDQGKVIRFPQVEQLIDFLKKVA